jgi:hypothetical protein
LPQTKHESGKTAFDRNFVSLRNGKTIFWGNPSNDKSGN